MAISLSAITGGAQTGFTTPGYTPTADQAPDVNAKQWAMLATTGTQAGVTVHTGSSPFTFTYWKPKVMRVLGKPNPVTGLLPSVPLNVHKINVRKGMLPLAGQPYAIGSVEIAIKIPAGSDTADAANVKALLSCAIGALSQVSSGLGDTVLTGVP